MAKKKSRKSGKMQTSTLDTMPMSPPRGGRAIPKGFIPYEGIREEEIEELKLVFPLAKIYVCQYESNNCPCG